MVLFFPLQKKLNIQQSISVLFAKYYLLPLQDLFVSNLDQGSLSFFPALFLPVYLTIIKICGLNRMLLI